MLRSGILIENKFHFSRKKNWFWHRVKKKLIFFSLWYFYFLLMQDLH